MILQDDIAKIIWQDTYRHDTGLEWHKIKRGTARHKRVMAAAETVRYLFMRQRNDTHDDQQETSAPP